MSRLMSVRNRNKIEDDLSGKPPTLTEAGVHHHSYCCLLTSIAYKAPLPEKTHASDCTRGALRSDTGVVDRLNEKHLSSAQRSAIRSVSRMCVHACCAVLKPQAAQGAVDRESAAELAAVIDAAYLPVLLGLQKAQSVLRIRWRLATA